MLREQEQVFFAYQPEAEEDKLHDEDHGFGSERADGSSSSTVDGDEAGVQSIRFSGSWSSSGARRSPFASS